MQKGRRMSRPPIKAVEAIKNYCEKTQCRKCVFQEIEKIGDLDYVACQLQMENPCNWETERKEE